MNNYPRPASTSVLNPPGFASSGYGIVPLYDPNNSTTSPQINHAPNIQDEARPSVSEQPIGPSPFHSSQHNLFGGAYHPCSPTKASSSFPAGFPGANLSQAPYNQLNQHQQSPQPQPSQIKCSNSTPHQCTADQSPPVSQQPPLTSNVAHPPQPQWQHASSYGGSPIPRLPYSQNMNMAGEFSVEPGLKV